MTPLSYVTGNPAKFSVRAFLPLTVIVGDGQTASILAPLPIKPSVKLVDTSGKHNLAELRSYQDWSLRYYLKAVPGVAEVAAVGGSDRHAFLMPGFPCIRLLR